MFAVALHQGTPRSSGVRKVETQAYRGVTPAEEQQTWARPACAKYCECGESRLTWHMLAQDDSASTLMKGRALPA